MKTIKRNKKIREGADFTGRTFGLLKCKKPDGFSGNQRKWLCECKCGNTCSVLGTNLQKGVTTSCGCRNGKGKNSFHWKGCGELSGKTFAKIRSCAKRRNIQFKVTINCLWKLFCDQDRKCALTGEQLTLGQNPTASLDRIDSKLGYFEENVQWVHKDVNQMKMDLDEKYFIDLCKKIANNKYIK